MICSTKHQACRSQQVTWHPSFLLSAGVHTQGLCVAEPMHEACKWCVLSYKTCDYRSIYIYIYIYIHICKYAYMYFYNIYIYIYLYKCTYIYIWTFLYYYFHLFWCVHIHICIDIRVLVYVCVSVCTRTYAANLWRVRMRNSLPRSDRWGSCL